MSSDTSWTPTCQVVYKTIGDVELKLHVFQPQSATASAPAMVFFFGGGWTGGSPAQFYPFAAHFAELGIVGFCAEYRIKSKHGTTPYASVKDAKSAIRWVRAHADEFGVDPEQVISAGGSAGGHLALCTALVPALSDPPDPPAFSCVPQAVIAFNPVVDTSPDGFGADRLGDRALEISPLHHVKPGDPPMLIFHGTDDATIPIESARRFRDAMREAGNRCQLDEFPGYGHGFFNYGREDKRPYQETVAAADRFLAENGFIS